MRMRSRVVPGLTLLAAIVAVPVLAGFAGTDLFIAMAGRGAGAYPSNWFTTVYLYNPNAIAVTVDLTFLERNKDNVATAPPKITDSLAAGETRVYDNIVETTFGATAYGAVRIQCAAKVVASARVFSKESADAPLTQSFGQDFAATPASFAIGLGESTDILGGYTTQPYQDSAARFNIGCVETTGLGGATVRWIARDGAGQQQKSYDRVVPRLSQTQGFFHDYFKDVDLTNSRVSASVVAGSGRVICYGSLVTNDTEQPKPVQDPTTFEMVYPDKLLGIATVQHDATLTGDGTAGAPLGVAEGGVGAAQLPAQVVTAEKLADAAVTVHKLATSPAPAPGALQVDAMNGNPAEGLYKSGDTMFWAPGVTGDITAVNTAAGSGLSGGATAGDANLRISATGVTEAMLADRSVTATKLDANPPSGTDPLKLQWSPTTGAISWGPDYDKICPNGLMCGSTTQAIYQVTNTAAGTAIEGVADAGNGVVGRTVSGIGIEGRSDGGGRGVYGESAQGYGVHGRSYSDAAAGVYGISSSHFGVWGQSYEADGVRGNSETGVGVKGIGGSSGVYGSSSSVGVWGNSSAGYAVRGESAGGAGVYATAETGIAIHGQVTAEGGIAGFFENAGGRNSVPALSAVSRSTSGSAVVGKNETTNHEGSLGGGYGAYGEDGAGHSGYLGGGNGAFGESSATQGYLGGDTYAAWGKFGWTGPHGYLGGADRGVEGFNGDESASGYLGGLNGVFGNCNGCTGGYAGFFAGDVLVSGVSGLGTRDVYANSAGKLVISSSDARLKKDVSDLSAQLDVLAALGRLRGVTFSWDQANPRARELGNRREIGMIAQEVEAVLPELVGAAADGYRSLDYAKLTAFLIEVAKAQQEEIDGLKAALTLLQRAGE
jgi:hypothetical protein